MERIDTHVHCVPDVWREACLKYGHGCPDGMPAIPQWDTTTHLALMDELSITRSILSITSPGTHLKRLASSEMASLTAATNDALSAICAAHPSRFSFFASLPLPDVPASLAEIDRVFGDNPLPGVAGFCLMTNAHGAYLGDKALDPIFDALSARQAVVFMHPTTCHAAHAPLRGPSGGSADAAATAVDDGAEDAIRPLAQYPSPMLEFFFDTTRAVANLLLSGTVSRCPGITFIAPHAGAALPPLAERFGQFASVIYGAQPPGGLAGGDGVKRVLRDRFFFDLAGFPFPDQIHGLLRLVGPDRMLYGSDFPYTPRPSVVGLAERMRVGLRELFDEGMAARIECGNARALFGGSGAGAGRSAL
ncbi:amidohydrolase [Lineolata rhizophorae]|uniref:6-methylsalicylate decarboxylase n=1 Tax=Lineolata rhizophorae TaxID=578093 RepID=A0A6A6P8V8_9PEZI|nr:amidohydrolase [Lineolata rhizophorae]